MRSSFSIRSWVVEVSWVTAMSSGRVPSGRVRPSSAASIMLTVPAAWTFVIWGAIHGLYQIIGLLTRPLRDRLLCRVGLLPDSRPVRCVRTAVTFLLVSFAWIFFRAGSLSDAGVLVSALFTGWGTPASALSLMGLDLTGILMTVVSLGALVLLDRSVVYGDAPDGSDVLTADFSYITVLFAIVFSWALLLATDAGSTFIYFQF